MGERDGDEGADRQSAPGPFARGEQTGAVEWEGARGQRGSRLPLVLGVALAAVLVGGALSGLGEWQADVDGADSDPSDHAIPVTGGEAPPETDEGSLFGDEDEAADPPATDEQGEPSAAEDLSPTPALGSWRELPEAPVPARSGALAVWTGREALFWGGRSGHPLSDGAAYDPSADSWTQIADAPRRWRGWREAAVWAGGEMIVLADEQPLAYHPGTDAWREIAEAPSGQWAWDAAGWADGEVIVPSVVPGEGADGVLAYDPAADSWRDLPEPPLAEWDATSSAWLDGRLLLMGMTERDAERTSLSMLDPALEAWSDPQPGPVRGRWLPRLTPDSRDGRILAASTKYPVPETIQEWTPERGWRELPDVQRAPFGTGNTTLIDTGHGLLLWREDLPSATAMLSRDAEWVPVTTPSFSDGFSGTPVWTGEELVVWGRRPGGGAATGAVLSLDRPHDAAAPPEGIDELAGAWRWLPDPPLLRVSASMDWTGEQLLVWGSPSPSDEVVGAAYEPAEGTWEELPEAPIGGRARNETAWTGKELLVWGTDPQSASAYDPAQRRWRSLPDPPIDAGGGRVSAWTGTELVVMGGGHKAQAAAYDPGADTWRVLADPPTHGHRIGALWTGEEIVVITDALRGAVVRYDPGNDDWAVGTEIPEMLPTLGIEVAWTGEEVLAWGGEGTPVGWAYHPDQDRWRRLPEPWLNGTAAGGASGASAWAGAVWVVSATNGDRTALAAYDPAGDRWFALPPPPPGAGALRGTLAWTGSDLIAWANGRPLAFRPEP